MCLSPMGFRVSGGVCANGGCEKVYALCQHGGLSVFLSPRMSVSVSLSECVWMWVHLKVFLQLYVPDGGFACVT